MTSVAANVAAVSNVGSRIEAALANVQPIRDLARNWDIDIASCLEDYLKEIVQIGNLPPLTATQQSRAILSKTAGGGNGSKNAPPNFAQAALLLQNSSCVYSRKVEYLHSLVYSYLNEVVASTRNSKDGGTTKKTGGRPIDTIMEKFNSFDPDMEFLLLDDILPTDETPGGDKINLVERDDYEDEGANMDLDDDDINGNTTPNANDTFANSVTRLSLGGLSVTRIDQGALGLPDNSDGISAAMTYAAAARALMGTLINEGTDTGGGNLRLLSERCDICESGALLMPGSSITDVNRRETVGTNVSGFDVTVDPSIVAGDGTSAVLEPFVENEDGLVQCNDDNDDNDDGVGFELCENNSVGDEPAVEMDVCEDVSQNDPAPVAEKEIIQPKKESDPWILLDPHDAGSSKPRPLRIGVTYRLPPGLKDTPSASVTGARTRKSSSFHLPGRRRRPDNSILGGRGCLATATFEATISAAIEAKRKRQESMESQMSECGDDNDTSNKKGSFISDVGDIPSDDYAQKLERLNRLASIPLKGLAFGDEFAYVAKADAKRRAAERREQRKQMENEPNTTASDNEHLNHYDDDDHGGEEYDFGGADDDSFGGGNFEHDEADQEMNGDGFGPHSNVCMTSLDEAFSSRPADGQHLGLDGDLEGNTFEALCRAHIKAFSKGAERYAAETNLSRRVGDWQRRLAPILQEEEERTEFDIHNYGHRIIKTVETEISEQNIARKHTEVTNSSLSSQTNVVDFQSVTKDCTQFEVCRLFMASLMLSNSGNVLLRRDGEGAEETAISQESCLRIELLNSNFELPMETYLAPSAIEGETDMTSIEVS